MDLFFAFGTVACGLFFVGVVALIVLSIVRAQKRAAERTAAISGHAAHRQWEYRAADPTRGRPINTGDFPKSSPRRGTLT